MQFWRELGTSEEEGGRQEEREEHPGGKGADNQTGLFEGTGVEDPRNFPRKVEQMKEGRQGWDSPEGASQSLAGEGRRLSRRVEEDRPPVEGD